jgi:hypothetical protein
LLWVLLLAAAMRSNSPNVTAQHQAMKKLEFLVGKMSSSS